MSEKRDLVIFHDDADGYCSAGLVSVFNHIRKREMPIYYPIGYGYGDDIENKLFEKMQREAKGIDVLYILDFSFPAVTLDNIAEKLSPWKIVYLDHHATARNEMAKWGEIKYDRENSFWGSCVKRINGNLVECFTANNNAECGASLTWKHVKYQSSMIKGLKCAKNIDRTVRLCKDYDLWTHQDHNSMPFVTGISVSMPHPEEWRKILVSDTLWKKYIDMGKGIILQQKFFAKNVLKKNDKNEFVEYNGNKILLLNVPPQWTNIVSNTVSENSCYDGVLCYSITGISGVSVSLRTSAECELDAGVFMKEFFYGGGHKHAAGGRASDFNMFKRTLDIIKTKGREQNPIFCDR